MTMASALCICCVYCNDHRPEHGYGIGYGLGWAGACTVLHGITHGVSCAYGRASDGHEGPFSVSWFEWRRPVSGVYIGTYRLW